MDWDGFQREVLATLGHQVYRLAPDASPAEAASPPPALVEAIARAAGVDPTALPPLPPADALRTAAGKRALWPRLRALRRSGR